MYLISINTGTTSIVLVIKNYDTLFAQALSVNMKRICGLIDVASSFSEVVY